MSTRPKLPVNITISEVQRDIVIEDAHIFLEDLLNSSSGLDIGKAVITLLTKIAEVSPYLTWLLSLQEEVGEISRVWDKIHTAQNAPSHLMLYHLLLPLIESYKGDICGRC